MPKPVVNVAELIEQRDKVLEDLNKLTNKERDWGQYVRLTMKIKYHTDKEGREKKIEAVKRRLDDPEARIRHNEYMKQRNASRRAVVG